MFHGGFFYCLFISVKEQLNNIFIFHSHIKTTSLQLYRQRLGLNLTLYIYNIDYITVSNFCTLCDRF